ncbi:related to dolichyl-phosphate-mannose-glycolipid alpha-mannosyltransferase [Pseudozyma flocculosa]|uniref:Mannosyltransferase n=1 Tax=Pseudozyma flocculosa TaxID=84751 RepID=A0A5C3F258_9BASI|nr:related to dolichyl-phosphate-mannose-glycolipid alpha-mannosyltransferase [Pseudozyma flocculosa]
MSPAASSSGLRQRATVLASNNRADDAVASHPDGSMAEATTSSRAARLFAFLLLFRLANAFLTQTYFQPDEHWQALEVAHRLVFGYGYVTWEWVPTAVPSALADHPLVATWHNLFNGPIRSVLHPLIFVPTYWLLKVCRLDGTRLLVIAPRLQQAVFSAIGDFYLYRLAERVASRKVALCTLFVSLTNVYTFFTATRTFSNTLEATITVVALYYWPFVPVSAWRPLSPSSLSLSSTAASSASTSAYIDEIRPSDASLDRTVARRNMYRQISISNSIEVAVEVGGLVVVALKVAISALLSALVLDTLYFSDDAAVATAASSWPRLFGRPLPLLTLTPLSFFHRNVVASLSLFYGANPWHWYVTQGLPVLCTLWIPWCAKGWYNAFKGAAVTGKNGPVRDRRPLNDLAAVSLWTTAVLSLLGHKEFRFLQPVLPLLCIFGGAELVTSLPYATSVPSKDRRGARGDGDEDDADEESITYDLGKAARRQRDQGAIDDRLGRIESIGFLMPCHSTPWQSSLHWQPSTSATDRDEGERLWFISCPPPASDQDASTYKDQSDFFYADPHYYLSHRFPSSVDIAFPSSPADPQPSAARSSPLGRHKDDLGWRHVWPSHLVVFDNLLQLRPAALPSSADPEDRRNGGQSMQTVGGLLAQRGYVERTRTWNSFKHEDPRRDGDIVVLVHRSVLLS